MVAPRIERLHFAAVALLVAFVELCATHGRVGQPAFGSASGGGHNLGIGRAPRRARGAPRPSWGEARPRICPKQSRRHRPRFGAGKLKPSAACRRRAPAAPLLSARHEASRRVTSYVIAQRHREQACTPRSSRSATVHWGSLSAAS